MARQALASGGLFFALFAVACSMEEGPGFAHVGIGPNDCAPDGARLVLRGAYEAVSNDAEASPDSQGRVKAAMGTDGDGNWVYVGRAGDAGDTDFVQIGKGTFDVSDYPNNVEFFRMDTARKVFQESFIALAGTLTVTEVQPLRVTFHLESLNARQTVEDRVGTPRDGVVDGCIATP